VTVRGLVVRVALSSTALVMCLLLCGAPALADQTITAVDDYEFTLDGQNYYLHAGETFTQTGDRYTITDTSGQVMMEGYTDGRSSSQTQVTSGQGEPPPPQYWYSAQQDGYDSRVGMGYLPLKAGYKYLASAYYGQEQIEVREIATDTLVGYALLIPVAASGYPFEGYKAPISAVDTNGDGLVSASEIDAAANALDQRASAIPADVAAPFAEKIAAARTLANSGSMAQAYTQIMSTRADIYRAETERATVKREADQRRDTLLKYVFIAVGAVVGVGLVTLLVLALRRRTKKRLE
jgi:hypothetical protein